MRDPGSTRRVRIERLDLAHREELAALHASSREFLAPWEPIPPPEGSPLDHADHFRQFLMDSAIAGAMKHVIVRTTDARILGSININNVVRAVSQSGMLGYWIGQPYARQGYMREALDCVLELAFGEYGLHRVEANILLHNTASQALVRRAGFRSEGIARKLVKIAGRWQDHERWALLEDEYLSATRAGGDAAAAEPTPSGATGIASQEQRTAALGAAPPGSPR